MLLKLGSYCLTNIGFDHQSVAISIKFSKGPVWPDNILAPSCPPPALKLIDWELFLTFD